METSDSEQEEDTALLAIDEDPRQRRNELKRRLLDRRAFIAERVSVPQGTNKNRRKQMAGTNLVYHKCDEKDTKGPGCIQSQGMEEVHGLRGHC